MLSKITPETLNKKIILPANSTQTERRNAAKAWLSENVKDKYLIAVDGRKIRFNNKKSVWHLQNDASFYDLEVKAIPYIVDVFCKGTYLGATELDKQRHDFKRIHVYQKWVNIDGKMIHLEAKAGEYPDGNIDVMPNFLLAYSQHILNKAELGLKKTAPSKASLNNPVLDSEIPSPECGIAGNDNLVLDDTQEKYAALTILEVKDTQADEIRHKVNNLLKRYGL